MFVHVIQSLNDLLKKGFPSAEKYAFRVEFDNTSSSGTQVTPHLQRTFDNNTEGELKVKCNCKDYQTTSTENLKQDVSFEFGTAKHSARGVKWTLNLSSNLSDFVDKSKGKFTGEFKNDFSNSSVVFEHPFKQQSESKLTLNSVFGSKEKGLSAGVDSEISISSHSLQTLNAAIACNKKDIDISLFLKKKFGNSGGVTVGTNYFQKVENSTWKDLQVGGEVSYGFNEKATAFTLATSFKPADASTLKARYDSKGLLGFLYTEKWNGPLSVSFGSDFNLLNPGNPIQHSIKLAFK
jgi:hypothetical protein